MKRSTWSCIALTAFVASSIPAGCASSTEKARTEARASAESFQQSLEKLPAKIDAANTKLVELMAANNTNRAQTFREFSDQLTYLRNAAKDLDAQADVAKADSQKFFREYTGSAMSGRDAAERKAAMDSLSTRQDAVKSAMSYLEAGRKDFNSLAGSFRDLQNDLRSNLGADAISKLSPRVESTIRQANDVKNYIARLDEQINAALNLGR